MPNRRVTENVHWQQMFDYVMADQNRRTAMAGQLSQPLNQVSTANIFAQYLTASGLAPITQNERLMLDTLDQNYSAVMTGFRAMLVTVLQAQTFDDRDIPRLRVDFDYTTSYPGRVEIMGEVDHGRLSTTIVFPSSLLQDG